MLITIKGIYGHGKITLTEEPPVKDIKADVIVTFLTEKKNAAVQLQHILGGLEGKFPRLTILMNH